MGLFCNIIGVVSEVFLLFVVFRSLQCTSWVSACCGGREGGRGGGGRGGEGGGGGGRGGEGKGGGEGEGTPSRKTVVYPQKAHTTDGAHYRLQLLQLLNMILLFLCTGGLILAIIEGVGIAINRAVSEQFKPG